MLLLVPCNYIQTRKIFVKDTYRACGVHNIWILEKLQAHTKIKPYYSAHKRGLSNSIQIQATADIYAIFRSLLILIYIFKFYSVNSTIYSAKYYFK
jgi:hypothetical protein